MPSIDAVARTLNDLAPLRLAGSWDNVGLLLRGTREVRRVGVCIDLTEPVLSELLAAGVDLVVSYHPPIFRGLKRLTGATGLERVLLRLIREGVHLYAPHSALDAAEDGMADWLAGSLGDLADVTPIEPDPTAPSLGAGRRGRLEPPASVRALLPGLKATLGLDHVRVAGDLDQPRGTFAVCPGSGGSLFKGLPPTDLLLTGELGHHEVLAQVAAGGAVILTDHTNTERGYLPQFARQLAGAAPDLSVVVSQLDADPLRVV